MKKSQETTAKILEAAVELLKTQDNVTIKDICDKAYTNIAAVNYHFGDKDTLITAAVQQILDKLKMQIRELAEVKYENTSDAMYAFVDLIYNFSSEYQGAIKYILNSSSQADGNGILNSLVEDKQFTDFVLQKIQPLMPSSNRVELTAKYLMLISAFLFPMVYRFAFGSDDPEQELKNAYIGQMLKILTN